MDAANQNAGYIAAMSDRNVLRGEPNGWFYPDRLITYEEVVAALVRLLGYEPAVDPKNSSGYSKIAASIGLLNGISNTEEADTLSAAALLVMVYNALDIPLMVTDRYGSEQTYKKDKGRTLLTEVFGLYSEEGRVEATGGTALTHPDSGLKKDQVKISGRIYQTGESSVLNYLGHRIRFLYQERKEIGEREIACVGKDLSRSVSFDAEKIASFSDSVYTVWSEDDKRTERYKLAANRDVIYNGRSVAYLIENHVYWPKTGKVRLVDFDRDGIYDTIFVHEYITMFVDSVDIEEKILYDRFHADRNIHIADIRSENLTIKDDTGALIDFEQIAPKQVAYAGWSQDHEMLELTVSNQKVTGTVSGMIKEDERIYFTIGETRYPLSRDIEQQEKAKLQLGEERIFYLDPAGAVFASEALDKEEIQTGYLINATVSGGFAEQLSFKILTLSNELRIFNAAPSLLLDGEKYKDKGKTAYASLLDNGKVKRSPVYYQTNEQGEIVMLDTPYIQKPGAQESIDSLHQYMDTGGSVVYKYGMRCLNGKILLDAQTIVFIEPSDTEDEEAYAVTNYSYFKDDASYSGKAYTDVQAFDYAKILTIKGGAPAVDWASGAQMITEVYTTLNEEGDSVQKIKTYKGQQKEEYEIKDASVLNGKQLEPGDLILVHADAKNRIDDLALVYDESEDAYYTDKIYDPETFNSRYRMLFAAPLEKVGNILKFSTDGNEALDDNSNLELYDAAKFPIIQFDRKTGQVEEAKTAEGIIPIKNDEASASKVFLYTTWANPIAMYVYNN